MRPHEGLLHHQRRHDSARDVPSKRPDYFGITVGKTLGAGKAAGKDGTYTGAAVAIVTKNTTYAVTQSSVTLAGGRTKGTFSGTAIGGGKVSGSFACE